ncbi:MAG: hypothetical protein ABSG62_14905 [Terracidiphilus sp.]
MKSKRSACNKIFNNPEFTSSREIARLTGKSHQQVLEAIELASKEGLITGKPAPGYWLDGPSVLIAIGLLIGVPLEAS